MVLRQARSIDYEGHWKGWALEIETFLGPNGTRFACSHPNGTHFAVVISWPKKVRNNYLPLIQLPYPSLSGCMGHHLYIPRSLFFSTINLYRQKTSLSLRG